MNDFIKDLDPKLQKLYKKQEEKEFNRLTDLMEEGRELRDSIITGEKGYTTKDIKLLEKLTNKFALGLCEIVPFQGFTTFRKQYIIDLKKVEKKKFLENDDKFLMRATNTNPAAMDVVWSWDVIGIRFIKKNITYSFSGSIKNQPHILSGTSNVLRQYKDENKQEKDWRNLVK